MKMLKKRIIIVLLNYVTDNNSATLCAIYVIGHLFQDIINITADLLWNTSLVIFLFELFV